MSSPANKDPPSFSSPEAPGAQDLRAWLRSPTLPVKAHRRNPRRGVYQDPPPRIKTALGRR